MRTSTRSNSPAARARSRWIAALALGLCALSTSAGAAPKKPAKAPAPATAAPSAPAPASVPAGPQEHTGLSHVLGFLDWGASAQDVMGSLKKEVDQRYADLMRELRDPMEIDRALRRKATEFAAIEKTLVQFSGQRTGYESSLIGADFVPDNEEAMIRIDDQDAQRYYFFKNDRLWKILVAYSSNVSRATPFPDFVRQVQDKYGRALSAEWSSPKGGAKAIISSTWEDPITQLVVEDRSEFFGTYCMKFLDKAVGVPLEAERASRAQKNGGKVATDASVDAALLEITQGDHGGDDAVVDRLTGTDHAVDLAGNRPDYETSLNRGAPVVSPTYPRDEQGGGKGKAKGKAKGKGDDKGKGAAAPAATKPGQPVIIY